MELLCTQSRDKGRVKGAELHEKLPCCICFLPFSVLLCHGQAVLCVSFSAGLNCSVFLPRFLS